MATEKGGPLSLKGHTTDLARETRADRVKGYDPTKRSREGHLSETREDSNKQQKNSNMSSKNVQLTLSPESESPILSGDETDVNENDVKLFGNDFVTKEQNLQNSEFETCNSPTKEVEVVEEEEAEEEGGLSDMACGYIEGESSLSPDMMGKVSPGSRKRSKGSLPDLMEEDENEAEEMYIVEKQRRTDGAVIDQLPHEEISHPEKDHRKSTPTQIERKNKKKKSKEKQAGVKETYYGYDDDSQSVDSEMSMSSRLSTSRLSLASDFDDTVFDEVSREELESNYQRLFREHLQLEKAFSTLQARTCSISPAYQNANDYNWLEEQEVLNRTIRMLKNNMREQEKDSQRLRYMLHDVQEQNEILEFRILELGEMGTKNAESERDADEFELLEKNLQLEAEMTNLQSKLKELQSSEVGLKKENGELREDIEAHINRYNDLQMELGTVRDELGILRTCLQEDEMELSPTSSPKSKKSQGNLTNEISNMNAESEEIDTSHLGACLEKTEQLCLQREKDIQALKEELVNKECMVSRLEKRVEELTDRVTELDQCNNQENLHGDQSDQQDNEELGSEEKGDIAEKVADLVKQLEEVKASEEAARNQIEALEEEKTKKIEALQDRLACIEENDLRLSETVIELEEVEHKLRLQIREYEARLKTADENREYKVEITKLKSSKQNLIDKMEQMEANERLLKERLEEIESVKTMSSSVAVENKPEGVAYARQIEQIEECVGTIDELSRKVERLTRREGELLEDLYQMKLENQELQERIDELVAEAEEKEDGDQTDSPSVRSGNLPLPDIITQLQSEITKLEGENIDLKDQILRTKFASIDNIAQTEDITHCAKCTETQLKISELQKIGDSQIELRENVRDLKAEIENKNRREKYLLEKMDCLEQSESKLLEIVNALEKNEESLKAKLESQSGYLSAEHSIIRRNEVVCQTQTPMTSSVGKDESEIQELRHLREKVEILMDSEEKLMSRLFEQEEVENGLNEQIERYKTEIVQLEIANQELREKRETEQSIENTRLLKDRINQLEKAETNLKKKASALDNTVKELHEFNKQLQEKLLSQLDSEKLLKKRIGELENSEESFINKLSDLESHNGVLIKLVEQRDQPDEEFSSEDSQTGSASEKLPETPRKQPGFKQCPSTPDALARLESHSPDISNDAQDLICLDKDDLVAKICELKQMEKYQQIRIMELTENLNNFREAVQVAAVTMETDNGHPVSNFKVKQQDAEFQACVQELIKSELVLKLNVLELEKKEAILNSRLQKANVTLKEQETDYKEDIDRLEQEIDKLRRNEARLKNKLQYGGWGQESQALTKVDHLQGLVFDLEVSERKLKRRVHELEHIQRQLRDKLEEAESIQNAIDRKLPGNIRDIEGKHHGVLVAPPGVLDFSTSTEKRSNTCGENSALSTKIADIELSEKGLRRHLDLLENQEPNLFDEIPAMLDSPNAILKQRISELEKIERHMKKQLVELEKDRDELHEITRKDKGLIHELSVQNRELELSEKSMKDQINRYEAQETQQLKHVQDMTDKLEELEDTVSKLEAKERRLKAKLHKQHATETDLTTRLDTSLEDAQNIEQKLSRRVSDLEKERLALQGKVHELTDRVGVLELSEISLKQKLRTTENSDASLKREVEDLEKTETQLTRQAATLENQNEALSQDVHKLQDETSSLLCEVSDLETTINKLQKTNKSYEKKILHSEKELEEKGTQDAELKEKLKQHAINEQQLQKTVDDLEQNAQRLRMRIRELEARVPMTDNEIILSSCLGQDNRLSLDQDDGILQHLETENFRLQEKLKLYEICQSDHQMATLPKSELEEMRSQLQLLPELEEAVAWREKSENHLKDTITKLREGKDACGHEKEIEELREQASRTNFLLRAKAGLWSALSTTKKANYLLKTNYGDVKEELQRVKVHSQSGSIINRPPRTMDTAVQVNLRQMSPEFKSAMRNLGANHPEAFAEFIQLLPGDELTSHHHGDQLENPSYTIDEARDDTYKEISEYCHHPSLFRPIPNSHVNSSTAEEFIILPQNSQGRKTILIKSVSVDAEPELVRYLVTAVPDNQSEYVTWAEEEPYWNAVEGKTYVAETKQKVTPRANKDDGRSLHWTVQFTKDLDHLTDADDESPSMRSDASVPPPVPSSLPPPLPGSRPPPSSIPRGRSPDADSYYLPSWQNDGDSADEAPEIDDEINEMDDVIPSPPPTRIKRTMRAKSAERDSDFSEGTYSLLGTSPQERRGKHFRLAGSLDSIPDSGVYPDDDVKILKDRIRDLQSEIKVKEKELELERKQNTQHENVTNDHTDHLDLESQLKEKETELQSEKKLNSAQKKNLSDKSREIEHLKSDAKKLDRKLNTKTVAVEDLTRVKEELQTKLQTQSRDMEIFALQKQDMESKITVLESELRNKEERETELTKMNASLKHQVDGMDKQNAQYRLMQEDYEAVRAKYDEMEQIKLKAQSTITPLRAKVIRLAHMCQNKDDLITRLASELRCYTESSDVIDEADRERVKGSSEDYGRPISPLTIRNLEYFERELSSSEDGLQMKKPSRIPLRVSPLSLSSSGSPGSDSPDGTPREHCMFKPITSHSADVQSADAHKDSHPHKDCTMGTLDKPYGDSNFQPPQLSFSPVTHLNVNQLNRDASKHNLSHKRDSMPTRPMLRCRVLRNYEPEFYTETGLRHLDRVLQEGDIVKAMGPVDDGGNYEVYVNGKVGLVPASYLRPLQSPTPTRRHKHRRKQPLSSPVTSSPEQILQMHDQLQHSHVPSIHVPHSSTALPSETHTSPRTSVPSTPPINHPAYVRTNNTLPPVSPKSPRYGSHPVLNPDKAKPPHTPTPTAGPPKPPSHFHIEKVVGKHSIVLGWITPEMDVMGQSNGVIVKGYQIYINQRERQVIASAHVTKALVEKLDFCKSHRFGIQTLSEDGQVSVMVQTVLEDFSPELGTERFSDKESTAGDSSSVVSVNLHDDTNKRVFMAVYDYSPSEHSPHHYPVEELSFKTGDIIATYGNVRDDGFYYSKVHGKKGLVPASFIEEVALVRSPSIRSTSSGSVMSHGNYAASTSSRTSGRHHHDNRSHHKHATKLAIAQV